MLYLFRICSAARQGLRDESALPMRGLSDLRPDTVMAQEFVTWLRDRGGRRGAGSGAVTALGRSTGYG